MSTDSNITILREQTSDPNSDVVTYELRDYDESLGDDDPMAARRDAVVWGLQYQRGFESMTFGVVLVDETRNYLGVLLSEDGCTRVGQVYDEWAERTVRKDFEAFVEVLTRHESANRRQRYMSVLVAGRALSSSTELSKELPIRLNTRPELMLRWLAYDSIPVLNTSPSP